MRYAIVIEKAEGNYSAYVPDLPGCQRTQKHGEFFCIIWSSHPTARM